LVFEVDFVVDMEFGDEVWRSSLEMELGAWRCSLNFERRRLGKALRM
jgi:hypothetical protein